MQSKIRTLFITSHCQAAVQPSPGKQNCSMFSGDLGRQISTLQTSPFFLLPPDLHAEHGAMWYGPSIWSSRVGCPGCVPLQHPGHTQPIHCGEQGCNEKQSTDTLTEHRHYSVTIKTFVCYLHYFAQKSKT